VLNQAVSLNGLDDYLQVGTADIADNLTQGTFSFWFMTNAPQVRKDLISYSSPDSAYLHEFSFYLQDGALKFWAVNQANSMGFRFPGTIEAGEWYHVVITADGNNPLKGYING